MRWNDLYQVGLLSAAIGSALCIAPGRAAPRSAPPVAPAARDALRVAPAARDALRVAPAARDALRVAPAARDAVRVERFSRLFGEHHHRFAGSAEGQALRLDTSAHSISGTGPHGALLLTPSGSALVGRHGIFPVSVAIRGNTVTGTGPHGAVDLAFTNRAITGRAGGLALSVSIDGHRATGVVRNQIFTIEGDARIQASGLAALLGVL